MPLFDYNNTKIDFPSDIILIAAKEDLTEELPCHIITQRALEVIRRNAAFGYQPVGIFARAIPL